VVRISEISTAWIARYDHLNLPISFFRPCKNMAVALHKLTFYEKMSKMVVLLWILFLDKLSTQLKNFTSLGIVQHAGKNLISRKK